MIVVGSTGSIAMGKSTVGGDVRRARARRCSTPTPRCTNSIAAPEARRGRGGVSRRRASMARSIVSGSRAAMLGDAAALKRLEAIVHPEVARGAQEFLAARGAAGRRLVVVDVPLLFETGGDRLVDIVVVVSASAAEHSARARSPEPA